MKYYYVMKCKTSNTTVIAETESRYKVGDEILGYAVVSNSTKEDHDKQGEAQKQRSPQ